MFAELNRVRWRNAHLINQTEQEAGVRESNRAAANRAPCLRDGRKTGLRRREGIRARCVREDCGSIAFDTSLASEFVSVVVFRPGETDVARRLLIEQGMTVRGVA